MPEMPDPLQSFTGFATWVFFWLMAAWFVTMFVALLASPFIGG